jgi:hypothetical protein
MKIAIFPLLAALITAIPLSSTFQEESSQNQDFTQVYQDQSTGLYYEFNDDSQQFFQVDPASLDFYPDDEEAAANFEAALDAEGYETAYFDGDEEIAGEQFDMGEDAIAETTLEFDQEVRVPSFQARGGRRGRGQGQGDQGQGGQGGQKKRKRRRGPKGAGLKKIGAAFKKVGKFVGKAASFAGQFVSASLLPLFFLIHFLYQYLISRSLELQVPLFQPQVE